MYFGSVRFFKHLILFVFFSTIVTLGAAVVVLAGKKSAAEVEIETLNRKNSALEAVVDFNSGKSEMKPEDFYDLMHGYKIDKDEFLKFLYENDKDAYRAVIEFFEETSAGGAESDESGESGSDASETASTGGPNAVETFPTITLPDAAENSPITSTSTATETEPPAETEFYAEYMDMFPHLYAMPELPSAYNSDDDYVYLTFDDGPSIYTNSVLSILGKYDVQATFFVIPDDNDTCKAYLNRMLEAGHSIGIHSMSHDYDKIYESVEAFLEDFNEAYNLVYDQTGFKPYLFRFPGGSINDYNTDTRGEIMDEMARRGFIYYDWSVDSRDSAGATWTQMYDSVLNDIADLKRSVVLFHDGPSRQNTVYVLEDIVQALLKSPRGYTLAAITEGTRPEQH